MRSPSSTLGSKLAAPLGSEFVVLVLLIVASSFLADLLGLEGWQRFLAAVVFAAACGGTWRLLEFALRCRKARRLDRAV